MPRKHKIVKSVEHKEAVFVCPSHVNSTVRVDFSLDLYDNLNAELCASVAFGDCDRWVTWHEYSVRDGGVDRLLERLNNTIPVLMRAQAALLDMKVQMEKVTKKYDQNKKKNKK